MMEQQQQMVALEQQKHQMAAMEKQKEQYAQTVQAEYAASVGAKLGEDDVFAALQSAPTDVESQLLALWHGSVVSDHIKLKDRDELLHDPEKHYTGVVKNYKNEKGFGW